MKQLRILLPLLALALLLSGCAGEEKPYEYVRGDISVTVDPANQTITHGNDVYSYEKDDRGNHVSYAIDYPNGAIYHWSGSRTGGAGGWSGNYDEIRYLSGDFLVQALEQSAPREKTGNFGAGLLLMALGAVNILFPEVTFHLRKGWMFRDAEPSDAYLFWGRVSGALVAVLGLVWCIV